MSVKGEHHINKCFRKNMDDNELCQEQNKLGVIIPWGTYISG
jgi:hypothetical protein